MGSVLGLLGGFSAASCLPSLGGCLATQVTFFSLRVHLEPAFVKSQQWKHRNNV